MSMKKSLFIILFIFIFYPLFETSICLSQEDSTSADNFNLGTDLVSRYVWRGLAFDESFCVQPAMSYSISNFSIGVWGSYSIVKEIMDECDLYLSYTIPTNSGNFSAYLYDYHNPNYGGKYFNFDGKGEGAHLLELYIQFDGSEKFPLTFLAGYNIHNDPDNSKYFEIGYKHSMNDVNLSAFFGFTSGISSWYQVYEDKFAFINTGINASKKIKISGDFSPTLGLSFIINPYIEKSYLTFKLSI